MRFSIKAVLAGVCAAMMFTSAMAADIGTVNVDVVNVRESASFDGAVLGQLNMNVPVSVLGYENGWNRIAYCGGEAYILGQYINIHFLDDGATFLYGIPKFGSVNVDVLNVRAAASFESEIVRSLHIGEKLELVGESGDFYLIQDGMAMQFVAKAYITEITYDEYKQVSYGENVIAMAMNYIGTPYRYGGSTPSGFDCSGFTSYVYAQLGVSLNRTAAGQMQNGYYVSLSELQPGDLVFFGSGSYISHVGIYVGDGNMIHSPYSGRSVCIESIYSSYFAPRLYGARRIF